jgi:hypothetical protein
VRLEGSKDFLAQGGHPAVIERLDPARQVGAAVIQMGHQEALEVEVKRDPVYQHPFAGADDVLKLLGRQAECVHGSPAARGVEMVSGSGLQVRGERRQRVPPE